MMADKIEWMPERINHEAEINSWMSGCDEGWNEALDACAAAYRAWLAKQKPVGYGVLNTQNQLRAASYNKYSIESLAKFYKWEIVLLYLHPDNEIAELAETIEAQAKYIAELEER
jgi:hypothetical protein